MNKLVIKLSLALVAVGFTSVATAQSKEEAKHLKEITNWYNGGGSGMQTEKAYKMVKKKTTKTVVVAIIDSGIDIEHVDLKGKIWTNTDEIAGNGIDDDKNGYIDDIHGWNFLGNANGENANDIRLEMTRIYAKLRDKYEGKDVVITNDDEREEYLLYVEVKEKVEEELANAEGTLAFYKQMLPNMANMALDAVKQELGKDVTADQVEAWKAKTPQDQQNKGLALMVLKGELDKTIERVADHFSTSIDIHYNADFNGRAIVGDNPDDFSDVTYGNNDVEGPDAGHGTHVGGIVGALRGNDVGGDGVATDILLMSLRAVPNGDEFDKDIALSIRYAVDNGAQVINMSFGKAYSPHAQEVYDAFAYADSKGVLLVHAAGNDNKDIDEEPNFPTSMYDFQDKKLDHFLTIGACTRYNKTDDKRGNDLPASFSNYGSKGVDVFAPGHDIYSSIPQSEFASFNGTSMACPMVVGAAAFLKSYFPDMSMLEIKTILLETSDSYVGDAVIKPGGASHTPGITSDMVDFGNLSTTGGVINLAAATKACLAKEK